MKLKVRRLFNLQSVMTMMILVMGVIIIEKMKKWLNFQIFVNFC